MYPKKFIFVAPFAVALLSLSSVLADQSAQHALRAGRVEGLLDESISIKGSKNKCTKKGGKWMGTGFKARTKPCVDGYSRSAKGGSGPGSRCCMPCPAGKYTASHCKVGCCSCPKGTYQDKPAQKAVGTCEGKDLFCSNAIAACRQCPAGFYAHKRGMSECLECGKGTYLSNYYSGKRAACNTCPKDMYSPGGGYYPSGGQGVGNCKNCPKGKTTVLGSLPGSAADCVDCKTADGSPTPGTDPDWCAN